MTRIFIEAAVGGKTSIELIGEKARYLATVLRYGPGRELDIIDRSGAAYRANVASISKKAVTLLIGERCDSAPESPANIILMQALLKGEKMDFIVQKASELGVRQLLPVVTERSQIRESRKLQRWKKIAEEASRQCGRAKVTKVLEPKDLDSAIDTAANTGIMGLIFWEHAKMPFSSSLEICRKSKELILLTGPEGGFSEREVRRVEERGYLVTSMGKRILRAETAAIAAVSITQYVLGDLSGNS